MKRVQFAPAPRPTRISREIRARVLAAEVQERERDMMTFDYVLGLIAMLGYLAFAATSLLMPRKKKPQLHTEQARPRQM
jgi:hypothetical protein